jgi:hypothetical protein
MGSAKNRSVLILLVAAIASTSAVLESRAQPARGASHEVTRQTADSRVSIQIDDIASYVGSVYGRASSVQFTAPGPDGHRIAARLAFASGRTLAIELEPQQNGRLAAEFTPTSLDKKPVQIDCRSLTLKLDEPDAPKSPANKISAGP